MTSSRGNKYIYVMYVYDCITTLTTAVKNRSDKEIIQALIYLIEDLKDVESTQVYISWIMRHLQL